MSDATKRRLERARARLDRLSQRPEELRGLWTKLVGPLLRLVGWQARFETKELFCLLDRTGQIQGDGDVERAVRELEENIETAERACAVHGYVPTAHASWMYRAEALLQRIVALASREEEGARRALRGLDRTHVLPPLRIVSEARRDAEAKPGPGAMKDEARLSELELAAIDHIIEAARSETKFLERRRRLLEGARRLLLDASAALPLDRDGLLARQHHLTNEITKLDRLEAAGLAPGIALEYQVKQAARRGDRDRLFAALVALDGFAVALGDAAVARRTGKALDRLDVGAADSACGAEDVSRSAEQIFGPEVVVTIRGQYETLRKRAETGEIDPELGKLAIDYLAPGTEDAALSALVSVDGCFEVGASLAPIRVREMQEVARLVAHPTREMLLVPATEVHDLPNAVLTDPRAVLLDLASGRLLARKFVERRHVPVERTRLIGEVRVYVLDGSTSMLEEGKEGARARVRDAILLAELATLMRRLERGSTDVRLTLFYRFFTKRLGEVHRVATPKEALAAMADVVGNARKGGTDIQGALVSSLELIRDRKREDPDLARAGIVLVTDGNAPVDPEVVRAAREDAAGVSVGISVVALGEENPVLRDLVARQRARGERAFYHHIDDERLGGLCRGEALGPRVHASPRSVRPEALRSEMDELVTELEDLERRRSKRLAPDDEQGQGRRAIEEAAARDRASLDRRYARWFPAPSARPAGPPRTDGDDVDAVRVVLATIAEVVAELGGDGLRRKADAIELVERLLPDARLTPARFRDVLDSGVFVTELEIVHRAVSGARESFDDRLARARRTRKAS